MPRNLDKQISTPLYLQLKQILEEAITQGIYRAGDRLPTEEELCRRFEVSRITVRQALAVLASEGLVIRQQGSGTFVNLRSSGKPVSLRAVIPEEQWVAPLKRAVRLLQRRGQDSAIQLETTVLRRPQLHTKIVTTVGEGRAPDLALIDWVWLTEFADLHYLAPLDEINPDWVSAFKHDLLPMFVERNSYRGHFYGIQPEANVSLLWYRKDWFESEGLSAPRTWDELLEVGQHFAEERIRRRYQLGPFPLAFPGGPAAGETTTYSLSTVIWSAGGELVSRGRIVLDEEARRAVEFLYQLVHRHRLVSRAASSYGFNEVPRQFAQGAVALALGGSYEKRMIQAVSGWDEMQFRKRVGFVPFPAGPGGEPAVAVGGLVFVVFRQSSCPESSLRVLEALSDSSLMRDFCRRTGRNPTQRSVLGALDPERDSFIREIGELLSIGRMRPTIPLYARASKQLQTMLARVLEEADPLEVAIDHAQAVMNELGAPAQGPDAPSITG